MQNERKYLHWAVLNGRLDFSRMQGFASQLKGIFSDYDFHKYKILNNMRIFK